MLIKLLKGWLMPLAIVLSILAIAAGGWWLWAPALGLFAVVRAGRLAAAQGPECGHRVRQPGLQPARLRHPPAAGRAQRPAALDAGQRRCCAHRRLGPGPFRDRPVFGPRRHLALAPVAWRRALRGAAQRTGRHRCRPRTDAPHLAAVRRGAGPLAARRSRPTPRLPSSTSTAITRASRHPTTRPRRVAARASTRSPGARRSIRMSTPGRWRRLGSPSSASRCGTRWPAPSCAATCRTSFPRSLPSRWPASPGSRSGW